MYCFTCKLLPKTNKKFSEGFKNWRKTDEKKRIDTSNHNYTKKQALADAVVCSKTSSRINHQLVQPTEVECKYCREVLRCVIDVIVLLSTRVGLHVNMELLVNYIMEMFRIQLSFWALWTILWNSYRKISI